MRRAAIIFWGIAVILCVACQMGTAWAFVQAWDGADPGNHISRIRSAAERRAMSQADITGIVIMEDGSSVPAGTMIERICRGRVTREARVASDGRFSFQIGGSYMLRGLLPEAGREPYDLMRKGYAGPEATETVPDLTGCELRACLQGYRSSRVFLDDIQSSAAIYRVTILLAPIEKVRGTLVSATDLAAPKSARKSLERAQNALRKNKTQDAEKLLEAALESFPGYAAAWAGLGQVYQVTRRIPEARKAYQRAIAADDKYVPPYIALAHLAAIEQNWQEAADLTDLAIRLDPVDFPEGYFFNAVAHYNLANFEPAERSARRAQRLDPCHRIPQACIVLADILEQKNDIAGAADQLRIYLTVAPQSPDAAQARAHLHRLESLSNLRAGGKQSPDE